MLRRVIPIVPAESLIPEGMYCYAPMQGPSPENGWVFRVKPCPYWQRYDEKLHGPLPENWSSMTEDGGPGAYCRYLKTGDWLDDGTWLLWDQVKACGVNEGDDDPWPDILAPE